MAVASKLPEFIKAPLRSFRDVVQALPYRGEGRFCPVCERSSSSFAPAGEDRRVDGKCAHCRAVERHRLVWLYFTRRTNLFDGRAKTVLHVAPEGCFEPRLRRRLAGNYLTADLFNPRADVKMDITDIKFPDESFDVIYCSHVLEHVPDDRQAMREFRRVLKSDGWAVLLVPINVEKTFEDPTVTDPAQRLRLFGQADHCRKYGPDYVDRLREAGFRVERTTAADFATGAEITEMGLTPAAGEIYLCRR